MKKILSLCLCVLGVFLCACSLSGKNMLADNDEKIAKEYIEKTLNTIESKDSEQLKNLFAKQCFSEMESFDLAAENLFNYFNASIISYDDLGAGMVDSTKEDDRIIKTFWSTLDIQTNKEAYRMMIKYVYQDTANTDNVGIHSIYVIKAADDFNTDFAYWGDGKDSVGINIGIKNTAKLEDMAE